MDMITRPHGIILLTGPTGSGKSTTLYTFLRYLAKEDTNIMTVEDPVENEIVGINQVQVNPKANLTFAAALRSFLRQDPNVIMIGEIRDEETAQIATRAAITGHLVLSSIHTNDAAGVITRLINMGIPKYLVADSLLGAISQRLVRKLCPKCKAAKTTTPAEMALLGVNEPVTIYEPTGCRYCNNTGYVGRIGVFEIMVLTDEMKEIIMSDGFTSEKIGLIVERDMTTILSHTKERVLDGITSLEEYDQLVDIV
jgi:type IV pilus assembly protein PilB